MKRVVIEKMEIEKDGANNKNEEAASIRHIRDEVLKLNR
jgi:hypothetical protein